MSATPPRSCCPTWLPRLPAKSSTSTPGSATWWPGSAAALLLLQISVADLDLGARAQARDVGVVLGRAEQLARAAGVRGLLLRRPRLGLDHLRDADQQVARLRHRHAQIGRQLGNVRRHDPPQYFRRQPLRVAPRHRARRAPLDAGVEWGAPRTVSRRDAQGLSAEVLRRIVAADVSKLPAYLGMPVPETGYLLVRISKVIEAEARPAEKQAADAGRAGQLFGAAQYDAYVSSLRSRAEIEVSNANLEKK